MHNRSRKLVLVVAAILLTGIAASAAHADGEWLIVQAGQLLDHPGQSPRAAASVLIQDGRIKAVRDGHVDANAFAGAPADTHILDLRDHFVLPGLIDSHVHLTSDKAGVEAQLESVTRSTAYFAYEAAGNARKTLAAGFTTVRNLGDRDGVTLALRDAIAAGKLPGPRILDAGAAISTSAGHMDPTLGFRDELHAALASEHTTCDGADDCRRAVRRQIARGVDVIKMATTGGVNSRIGAGLGQQMFEDEARAIVETAHLYGRKVAVHAHGADGIALALRTGADSIEHGTLLDAQTRALWRKSKAWYVPTLSTVNGYKERLAANPDAGVSLHGRNADEFELLVEFGLTPAQALRAATLDAAELLGVEQELGSLDVGKRADLIAVSGDPLQDVRVLKQVAWVIKDGRIEKSPAAP